MTPHLIARRIIYLIIAVFVLGNVAFIFIKYNSDKNINNLIKGNQQLLGEFKVNDELKTVENEVARVENQVGRAISTGDLSFIGEMNQQIAGADLLLRNLQKIADDDSTEYFIDELDTLVRRTLRNDNQIISMYLKNGSAANGMFFRASQNKLLADSIPVLTQKIVDTRQKILSRVTNTIDSSVHKIQIVNSFLVVFVLVSTAFVFLYIINTIRTQNRLIEQVSMSEKKVREAAMIKENFLANMSHEIRTPMTAILGFTSLLAQKKFDPESDKYVEITQRSAENLLAIVNDILDISKIEAGMMRLESAPFNIRTVVESVEAMLKLKAEEKSLEMFTEIDTSLPSILEGDATRLTQILVNLVGNAIKFTHRGAIRVAIANKTQKGLMLTLCIKVSDTGIGIDKKELPHIFDRFRQVDNTVIRKYGGTGLGLSIVKDLVDLHHGSIQVDSEPGRGTSFTLDLPFKISSRQEIDVRPEPPVETPSNFENARILIVEDNEINQSLLSHLLHNWHLQCSIANNGREALENLRSNQYDLILMDIQMPFMDGYSTAANIRNTLHLDTPIVAMTAHTTAGEKERCLRYGMNHYISKPVREKILRDAIARFLSRKQKPSAHPPERPPHEDYEFIQLDYMREVADGNVQYEKDVTRQFIDSIPHELHALAAAAKRNDPHKMKKIAHSLKTTVSVMGLTEILQPDLDNIESGGPNNIDKNIENVLSICQKAIKEAEAFLGSISDVVG